jgi:hypothetical protein
MNVLIKGLKSIGRINISNKSSLLFNNLLNHEVNRILYFCQFSFAGRKIISK